MGGGEGEYISNFKSFGVLHPISHYGYPGEGGKRNIIYLLLHCNIYLLLHCQHQNDSCIMVGGNDSRFSVFINCQGQSHKTVTTTESQFQRDRRAKAESN